MQSQAEVSTEDNMIEQFTQEIDYSQLSLTVSVIIRIIAAIYFAQVFRRSLKNVGIRNGLIALRRLLLLSASILFFITVLGLIIQIVRPHLDQDGFMALTHFFNITNSAAFLFVALIQNKIQTMQYSRRQLELHAKIENLEKKEERKVDDKRIERNRKGRQATAKKNKLEGGDTK